MYYFVLTNPGSGSKALSMYFTTYKESIEYAKTVSKYNPKIIKYDPSIDNTFMYDNILHIL